MTLAGRIRLYLVAVAVVPPLLVMVVTYFHSVRQLESSDRRQARRNLDKYQRFEDGFREECRLGLDSLAVSESLRRARAALFSGRPERIDLDPRAFGLDFLELLDSTFRVQFSHHRPGLLGEVVWSSMWRPLPDSIAWTRTVEYDIAGAHAALTAIRPLDHDLILYCGCYFDEGFCRRAAELLDAGVLILTDPTVVAAYRDMCQGRLYETQDGLQAVLMRTASADALALASFNVGEARPLFLSLLYVTGLVAAISVTVAVAVGIYVTGRAKREIDNLVQAADRIAGGDLETSVMAYEEGEFARLAEAFTHMVAGLKSARKQLATAEQIAAWQTAGRKMAHEIKNPLMPIMISVDDLRRSYHEGLPDFDKTLDQTTATIANEISRVSKLLDQFAGFARMGAPVIISVDPAAVFDGLAALYKREVESGRLILVNESSRKRARLDPDAIRQVLVNLVKNGFETGERAHVKVTIADAASDLCFTVEDDGPGFAEAKLRSSFEPYVSTKKGGSGLGLVICHRIVHDHGGSLDLYNRVEGGGGVAVTLPQS